MNEVSDARHNYKSAAAEAKRIRREVNLLRKCPGVDLRDKYLPIARECEAEARYWLSQVRYNDSSPEHPEAKCEDCGGANVVWHAPSPIWNKVCRPAGYRCDPMICPTCFIIRAEKLGVHSTSWRVCPEKLK